MNVKKISVLINILVFVGFFYVIVANLFFAPRISDFFVSEKEFDQIIENREETLNSLVDKIYFNGYELIEDKDTKTWFYSIVEGDKNSYNPRIKLVLKNKKLKTAILYNNFNAKSIENNDSLKVILYSNKIYYCFNVKFTTLPIMNVMDNKTYLFDNRKNALKRVFKLHSEMLVRGQYSSLYPKRGYKLTFYNHSPGNHFRKYAISLLGMPVKDDWKLAALYNDIYKIRQVFSSRLWNDGCALNNLYNLNTGFEFKYIELFLNNSYRGLYAIGYSLDKKDLNLKKDDLLLKISDWGNDYIVKGNHKKDLFDKYTYLFDYNDKTKNASIKNILDLYKIVDIQNSIDMWLFINLIQGMDNVYEWEVNNNYMIIVNKNNSAIILSAPWDLDNTWGISYFDVHCSCYRHYDYNTNNIMKSNIVYLLLRLNDSKIKKMLKDRYKMLRTTAWSDYSINNILNEYEKEIFESGAYRREALKHQDNHYGYINPKNRLLNFKKYVFKRLHYFDTYIEDLTSEKGII